MDPSAVEVGNGEVATVVFAVVVQTWLDGTPPGPGDWPAVTATLRRLHGLTGQWPQRPGFASTCEMLSAERGGPS